jgi:DNA-binding MarR family transcriptional regulator
MAHLTISVPRDRVDELRRHLIRAHAERAGALRDALDRYLVSHERLGDVHGGPLTRADLRAQLELSAGGAEALTRKLVDQALVVRAPDPNDRTGVRLRLSDGADVEVAAALHRLIDHLDMIAAALTDVDARLVGSFVDAMETPVRLSTAQPRPIE